MSDEVTDIQKFDIVRMTKFEASMEEIVEVTGLSEEKIKQVLAEYDKLEEVDVDFKLDVDYPCVQTGPRVLLFDVETSPAVSYHWGRYKIAVGVKQVISRPYLITWAAKWLGDDKIMSDMLPFYYEDFMTNPRCDKNIVKSLWQLLDAADIVIGHYVKRFDIPQMNTRFVMNGLKPPSPYKVICTKEVASAFFKFEGNSLAELADHLGVGKKIDTNFDTWRNCVENYGTVEGWNTMLEYNEMDVEVLENVYLKLRAYDSRHPNVSLYYGDSKTRCTVCGSSNMKELNDSNAFTNVSKFNTSRCGDCGHISRSRKNIRTKEEMEKTLINVAL